MTQVLQHCLALLQRLRANMALCIVKCTRLAMQVAYQIAGVYKVQPVVGGAASAPVPAASTE